MKCTNCGKNNANYHVSTNINGRVTEQHLCPECAAKLQPEREFAETANSMMRDFDRAFGGFMDDGFFGGGLLDGFFGGRKRGIRQLFAPVGFFTPALVPFFTGVTEDDDDEEKTAPRGNTVVDAELSRKREINSLRERMKSAAEREDYETAAKLRDELKKLESADGK